MLCRRGWRGRESMGEAIAECGRVSTMRWVPQGLRRIQGANALSSEQFMNVRVRGCARTGAVRRCGRWRQRVSRERPSERERASTARAESSSSGRDESTAASGARRCVQQARGRVR